MADELISKKELLQTYGISYGTLYRWRRSGLIPEEWFLRKSTETGQETFFPRALMVERINLIFHEKDGGLDALAEKMKKKEEDMTYLIIETKSGRNKIPLESITNITLQSGEKILTADRIMQIIKESYK